jgi:WD40 repeat protein
MRSSGRTSSPDGEALVTASTDNTACIWDLSTGRPGAPWLQHARIVEKAVFSPDWAARGDRLPGSHGARLGCPNRTRADPADAAP